MNKKYLEVNRKIKEYGTIILHRHSMPDGDAIGSQIGLREAIKATYPYKQVYIVGDMNERFKFMGSMDEISDDVYKQALVIVLDSGDEFLVSDERYKLGRYKIRLDHHMFRGSWCDFEIIEPEEVSCTAIIFKIILENNMKLTKLGAQALFLGIVSDSGRFRYDGVTSKTFELVSKLMEYDIDINEVYNNIYVEDLKIVKLRAELTSKFQITPSGVAYLINTQDDIKKYNTDIFTISRGMVSIMSGIRGIDIWANFTEDVDGKYKIEIRSNKYNINLVATKYGGGGHKLASGATLNSYDDIKLVLKDLDKILEDANGTKRVDKK